MSLTTRILGTIAITAAFGLIATQFESLFGSPLLWSATGGVIGVIIGTAMFWRRGNGGWRLPPGGSG
jgi:hypothetical protein